DGLGAATEVGLIEATLDPALAGIKLLVYSRVHSKTLPAGVNGERSTLHTPQKRRGFSSFSRILAFRPWKGSLIQGLGSLRGTITRDHFGSSAELFCI